MARQLVDRNHPIGDQAHEEHFVGHSVVRGQLLVEPQWALEGMEARLRSEEVGMVVDALRNAKRFHATVSFIADTGLEGAKDLGGFLFFFFGKNEADGYWQSTSETD